MKKWFGIFLAVCIVCSAVPAMAAVGDNFSLKGQVGLFTGYRIYDDDWNAYDAAVNDTNKSQLRWDSWDTAYIGVTYKTDKIGVYVEIQDNYSATPLNGNTTGTPSFDVFFAEYNFGGWQLGFGRQDPLSFNPYGTPAGKYANLGVGASIGGTDQKMIVRGTIPFSKAMNLQVMLGDPNKNYVDRGNGTGDMNVPYPLVEAKLNMFTGFPWAIWGGYQAIEGVYTTLANQKKTISSYQAGVIARPAFGALKLNATVLYDVNLYQGQGAPYQKFPTGLGAPVGWNYNPEVGDTTKIAGGVSAEYMFNKTVGLAGGWGYQEWTSTGSWKDASMGGWFNVPFYVHPQFRILPYYAILMAGDITNGTNVTTKQGTQHEIGIFWRIEF